jgi:hypothetical protein
MMSASAVVSTSESAAIEAELSALKKQQEESQRQIVTIEERLRMLKQRENESVSHATTEEKMPPFSLFPLINEARWGEINAMLDSSSITKAHIEERRKEKATFGWENMSAFDALIFRSQYDIVRKIVQSDKKLVTAEHVSFRPAIGYGIVPSIIYTCTLRPQSKAEQFLHILLDANLVMLDALLPNPACKLRTPYQFSQHENISADLRNKFNAYYYDNALLTSDFDNAKKWLTIAPPNYPLEKMMLVIQAIVAKSPNNGSFKNKLQEVISIVPGGKAQKQDILREFILAELRTTNTLLSALEIQACVVNNVALRSLFQNKNLFSFNTSLWNGLQVRINEALARKSPEFANSVALEIELPSQKKLV